MPCRRWRAPRPTSKQSRARNVPSGRWRKCRRRFKMQTLTYCGAKITSTRTAVGQFKGQFNGAMEERQRKVQDASAHILQRKNHEHAHSTWSVRAISMGRWKNCQGGFKMQALTICDAEVVSTRTQQSVSSRASSRGRWKKRVGKGRW